MAKTDTPEPEVSTAVKQPDEPDGGPAMLTIEWNDRSWSMPADSGDWDFEASEALERGHGVGFLRAVLGRRQFARFSAGSRRTTRDADELMTALMAALGETNQGE